MRGYCSQFLSDYCEAIGILHCVRDDIRSVIPNRIQIFLELEDEQGEESPMRGYSNQFRSVYCGAIGIPHYVRDDIWNNQSEVSSNQSAAKSSHFGFIDLMRAIFLLLRQPLISFSWAIAALMSVVSSK